MRITRPRATRLSQITIDADLDMGTHILKTDVVAESTGAAGVTIDGVVNKDAIIAAAYTEANVSACKCYATYDEVSTTLTWSNLVGNPVYALEDGNYVLKGTVKCAAGGHNIVFGYRIDGGGWVITFNDNEAAYVQVVSDAFALTAGNKLEIAIGTSSGGNEVFLKEAYFARE